MSVGRHGIGPCLYYFLFTAGVLPEFSDDVGSEPITVKLLGSVISVYPNSFQRCVVVSRTWCLQFIACIEFQC